MSLTTRLLLFFLATLALVLGGFSSAVYFLARAHLQGEVEEHLDAALNTLVAVAEIGPEGIEWESAGRHVNLERATFPSPVIWVVRDGRNQIVEQGKSSTAKELLAAVLQHTPSSAAPFQERDSAGALWQFNQRRIEPSSEKAKSPYLVSGAAEDGRKYGALTITAGLSLEPTRATLRWLLTVLTVLSLGVWLPALFVGRLVCRRALLPVTRMAAAAGEMSADDLGRRLPHTSSRDELEELGRAFNNLLDRLQESFERQQRFTGDASHQLRTPLAAMLGQVEVALRHERSPEEYRRVLTTLQDRVQHLQRIVEALLFLARADAEARRPQLEPIALREWLQTQLQTWSDHPRARDLTLACDGERPDPIRVHPPLLAELINLLLDNACKFSPPGTPVSVQLGLGPDVVTITVTDEGCGISPPDLPLIFSPFFRSAEVRRQNLEGVGLGLAIAKRIVEAFGGTINAASQVGKGSAFQVTLPGGKKPPQLPVEK